MAVAPNKTTDNYYWQRGNESFSKTSPFIAYTIPYDHSWHNKSNTNWTLQVVLIFLYIYTDIIRIKAKGVINLRSYGVQEKVGWKKGRALKIWLYFN